MIIIKHRVNSLRGLIGTNQKFGVEIDLRSNQKDIYLHHDPMKRGINFKKWLKHYKHQLIVLNVKEEGLENEILKLLKDYKVNNFFFHDQTFSSLIKNMKNTNVSVRYSEFEEIKNKTFIFKYVKWVWIDNFNKMRLENKFYNFLRKKKIKICLVSPELVKKDRFNEIIKIKKDLKKKNFYLDAVCTKKPELWIKK